MSHTCGYCNSKSDVKEAVKVGVNCKGHVYQVLDRGHVLSLSKGQCSYLPLKTSVVGKCPAKDGTHMLCVPSSSPQLDNPNDVHMHT